MVRLRGGGEHGRSAGREMEPEVRQRRKNDELAREPAREDGGQGTGVAGHGGRGAVEPHADDSTLHLGALGGRGGGDARRMRGDGCAGRWRAGGGRSCQDARRDLFLHGRAPAAVA